MLNRSRLNDCWVNRFALALNLLLGKGEEPLSEATPFSLLVRRVLSGKALRGGKY